MGCCDCDDHDYCCRCVESDADRAQSIIEDVLDGSYSGDADIDVSLVGAHSRAANVVAVLKYEHIL